MASDPELQRRIERKEVHKFVYGGKEYLRKKRVPLAPEVREKLEEAFKSGRVTRGKAARPAKVRLAEELNLSLQQITKWFDNRRTKEYRQDAKMLAYIDEADNNRVKKRGYGGTGDDQAHKLARQGSQQHIHQQHALMHQQQQQQQPSMHPLSAEDAQQQQQQAQGPLEGQPSAQSQDRDDHQGQQQSHDQQQQQQQQEGPPMPPSMSVQVQQQQSQGQDQNEPGSQPGHEMDELSRSHASHVSHAMDHHDVQHGLVSRARKDTDGFSMKLEENNLSEENAKDISRAFRTVKLYLDKDPAFYQVMSGGIDMHDQDAHGENAAFAARRARRRTKVPPTMSSVFENLLSKDSVLYPCVRAVQIAASHGAIKALKTLLIKRDQDFRTLLLWYIIGKYSGDREVEVIMKSIVAGLGAPLQTLNVADILDAHFPELIESKSRGTYDGPQSLDTSTATAPHIPSAGPTGDPSRVIFSQDVYSNPSHWAENFLSEAFVGLKIMHDNMDGEILHVLPPASRSSKEPRFQIYFGHQNEAILGWESVKPYLVSNQWPTQHAASQQAPGQGL
ncbi:Homeobox protein B-H1 [Hondaea fermentalgiana]|uniref:Homeobox protein B-H1 n=1 Tax=Hondaea fermentalgiana TaxID=2315210 RepID=A0A2R5GCP1_9STRA|nr:Homeobox protein B-H1 [Hondaea fermentalgiana]|eukprot:GBG28747.1 Homeobox protein B-H1 [Hondaea fermentalgiana]